jgi:hypothetical protein
MFASPWGAERRRIDIRTPVAPTAPDSGFMIL